MFELYYDLFVRLQLSIWLQKQNWAKISKLAIFFCQRPTVFNLAVGKKEKPVLCTKSPSITSEEKPVLLKQEAASINRSFW